MATLQVMQGFDDDLDALVASHAHDVGLMDALIEELADNEPALASLHHGVPKWGTGTNAPFEIKKFEYCWQQGRKIYLIKPYDEDGSLIGFRIFIAYDHIQDEYLVIAAQPRESCYDTSTKAFRDLCNRYDELGIFPDIG